MSEKYERSYRFYSNTDCEYFPCHEVLDKNDFNCLFCYCPLYFLGEKCGGNFKHTGSGGAIKDCSNCFIPHEPENYEFIVNKVCENLNQF